MSVTPTVDYDHSKKIGNEGDTVKHAVLASLTNEILSEMHGEPFVYAESHTGKRDYVLPEDGEWKNGIGQLWTRLEHLRLHDPARTLEHVYPNIQPYLKACFKEPIGAGTRYLGSSGIVASISRDHGTVSGFHLCDTDEEVCRSLRESYQDQPAVYIYHENGYEMLSRIEKPLLALVDPIFVKEEAQDILTLLAYLSKRGADFICWTALWGNDDSFYKEFKEEIDRTYSSFWIRWQKEKVRTWGCQITVPESRAGITLGTIAEIKDIMQWM